MCHYIGGQGSLACCWKVVCVCLITAPSAVSRPLHYTAGWRLQLSLPLRVEVNNPLVLIDMHVPITH